MLSCINGEIHSPSGYCCNLVVVMKWISSRMCVVLWLSTLYVQKLSETHTKEECSRAGMGQLIHLNFIDELNHSIHTRAHPYYSKPVYNSVVFFLLFYFTSSTKCAWLYKWKQTQQNFVQLNTLSAWECCNTTKIYKKHNLLLIEILVKAVLSVLAGTFNMKSLKQSGSGHPGCFNTILATSGHSINPNKSMKTANGFQMHAGMLEIGF